MRLNAVSKGACFVLGVFLLGYGLGQLLIKYVP
jgi:hypothetical protein